MEPEAPLSNPRSNRTGVRLLVSLLIIAALAFGATLFYGKQNQAPEGATEQETPAYVPDVINAKHQFKSGTHIIAGEVDVPTPCDLLETDSVVEIREPDAERVIVQFVTVNQAEICAQVITSARFMTSFEAAENAEIVGTWNGAPVRLNLIEVGADEDIEGYELYIKG